MLLDMYIGTYQTHLFRMRVADIEGVGDEFGVLLLLGKTVMGADGLREIAIGFVLDEAGEEISESSHYEL